MNINGGMEEDVLPPGKKRCTRCREPRLLTEFYAGRRKKDSPPDAPRVRMSWCMQCHKEYSKIQRRVRLLKEGESFLDSEAKRVAKYTRQQQVASDRAAAARATRKADAQLRRIHSGEYQLLLAAARREEGLAA